MTACVYDRGGVGWSEYVPGPRTIVRLSDELNALLTAAEAPGPFVLVGHSVGGIVARDFATRYRDRTAGLVLVDSSHELQNDLFAEANGWRDRRGRVLLDVARSRLRWRGAIRALDDLGIMRRDRSYAQRAFPAHLEAAGHALALTSSKRRADIREALDMWPGFAEAYALRQLLDGLPLTVLSTGKDAKRAPRNQAIWDKLQADLASLAVGSVHQVVDGAGHHIHLDQPQVVVKAILDLCDRIRRER